MLSSLPKLTLWLAISIMTCALSAAAQSNNGKLTGKVLDKDGKPVANVTVTVTNQTSSEVWTQRSKSDGSYSFRLRSGAYRIKVESPFEARFDPVKKKDYGVFSNLVCDETRKKCSALENVIIDGSERKIDFAVVEPDKEKA